ncbi:hypothetical protein P3T76_014332 [Phytophthora citrophthora]|uniref:Uncharacterized protein n=1 Tax=Phytophthora citrophthora TaxID=4793 RepID=A0AAD9LB54_9STRA|nr:hypothetical protein P3T76_014332 [Phytophthora citrophthora]
MNNEMRAYVDKIRSDWSKIKRVDNQRAVFQGQRDPGLQYVPEATSGVYALHCETTEAFRGLHHGPVVGGKASYMLKIGRSDDIARRFAEHAAPNSNFAGVRGRVEFLFGLAVASNEVTNAEVTLHDKLMQLCFAWPVVIQFPKRVFETYEFNAISLPLVHDVVRKIRCVVPPPSDFELPPQRYSLAPGPDFLSPAPGHRDPLPHVLRDCQPQVRRMSYFRTEVTQSWY